MFVGASAVPMSIARRRQRNDINVLVETYG
jgi:hypothetical protein